LAPIIPVLSLAAVSFAAILITDGSTLAQPVLPTLPPATMPANTPMPTTTPLTPPAPQAGSRQAGAQAGAEQCLSKPGPGGAAGTHWYYHMDRTTKRQCWYLGTSGGKTVRQTEARRRAASTPAPSEPVAEPAAPEQPAQAEPMIARPVATTPVQPKRTSPDQAASAPAASDETFRSTNDPSAPTEPSARAAGTDQAIGAQPIGAQPMGAQSNGAQNTGAPDLRTAQGAADPTPAADSDPQDQTATETEDDMPLVWPVLTPAELAAAGLAPSSSVQPAVMLGVLVGALAFAAVIARLLFKLFGTRQGDRAVVRDQRRFVSNPLLPRKPAPLTRGNAPAQEAASPAPSSGPVAVQRLVDALRSPTAAAPRFADIPRRPGTPAAAGEQMEDDLRTLLRDLQQRTAA